MSEAKKCDLCSTLYEQRTVRNWAYPPHKEGVADFIARLQLIVTSSLQNGRDPVNVDACSSCTREIFEMFLKLASEAVTEEPSQ